MKRLPACVLLTLSSVILLGTLSGCPPKKEDHEHKPGDSHDHEDDKKKK